MEKEQRESKKEYFESLTAIKKAAKEAQRLEESVYWRAKKEARVKRKKERLAAKKGQANVVEV